MSRYGVALPDACTPLKIGLLVMEGETDKPYMGIIEYLNVKATLENGKWVTDIPIYVNSSSATIYAYYPDTLNITDPKSIPVNSRLLDVLFCKCLNINNQSPNATIRMNHAFARLRVRIFYFGTNMNYAEANGVTIGNSKAKNFGMIGTLNIYSGELTPAESSSHIGAFMFPYEKYPVYDISIDKEPLEMLVFPTRFKKNEFAFRVIYSNPVPKTFSYGLEAGEWLPGTVNDYTLIINPAN